MDDFQRVMRRLCRAERERGAAISELKRLGYIRSANLVGDLGETIAMRYYEVAELEPPSLKGFDLRTQDGRRVSVRTMRSTDYQRTSLGMESEPYDILFVVELNENYEPTCAYEVPREVIDEHFTAERIWWRRSLERDNRVNPIPPEELGFEPEPV